MMVTMMAVIFCILPASADDENNIYETHFENVDDCLNDNIAASSLAQKYLRAAPTKGDEKRDGRFEAYEFCSRCYNWFYCTKESNRVPSKIRFVYGDVVKKTQALCRAAELPVNISMQYQLDGCNTDIEKMYFTPDTKP